MKDRPLSLPLKGITFSERQHWHLKEQQDLSCTSAPRPCSKLQGLSLAIPAVYELLTATSLPFLTQSLGPLNLKTTLMFITAVITAPLENRLIHSWRNYCHLFDENSSFNRRDSISSIPAHSGEKAYLYFRSTTEV